MIGGEEHVVDAGAQVLLGGGEELAARDVLGVHNVTLDQVHELLPGLPGQLFSHETDDVLLVGDAGATEESGLRASERGITGLDELVGLLELGLQEEAQLGDDALLVLGEEVVVAKVEFTLFGLCSK